MGGKKSRYRKLWKRWLIIEAVSGVICLLLSLNGDWELWIFLWLIFSFVCNAVFGPGSMTGRAYSIQKERERRLLREFNEMWYKKNKKCVINSPKKRLKNFLIVLLLAMIFPGLSLHMIGLIQRIGISVL